MKLKIIIAAVGIAAVALPLAVLASQPPVKRIPSIEATKVLSLLVVDPYEKTEMGVKLPKGFATFDVDADPFKG